jgi:hypothetical protein
MTPNTLTAAHAHWILNPSSASFRNDSLTYGMSGRQAASSFSKGISGRFVPRLYSAFAFYLSSVRTACGVRNLSAMKATTPLAQRVVVRRVYAPVQFPISLYKQELRVEVPARR